MNLKKEESDGIKQKGNCMRSSAKEIKMKFMFNRKFSYRNRYST
jgi:hypothetical protein